MVTTAVFLNLIELVKNVNFTRVINIARSTFNEMKNQSDGFSKAAIFFEGVIEIFS